MLWATYVEPTLKVMFEANFVTVFILGKLK